MNRPICTLRIYRLRRYGLAFATVFLIAANPAAPAQAGFLVGNSADVPAADQNDKIDDVIAVIDDFNASNDPNEPDLTTHISLFKKTDYDAGDLFNGTNDNSGFSFFEADMTTAITSESGLTDGDVAYFSYSGPENILYYSVKTSANDGFSLYTYMPGLNLLDVVNSTRGISHASFWVVSAPEPASWLLAATAAMTFLRRRR
jgi:hypothetical protein